MFEKMRENAAKSKLEKQKRKAEKEQRQIEAEMAAAREKERHLAEERAAIEAEKSRLLSLTDKEVMVELVFAIRGFYAQFEEMKTSQYQLNELIDDLKYRMSSVESDISDLESRLSNCEIAN